MKRPESQQHRLFYGLSLLSWVAYRSCWYLLYALGLGPLRIRAGDSVDGLPAHEPYLLLPNHTTALDPFLIGWSLWRPVRFMASESLLKIPLLGRWLIALGSFPKKKFTSDKRSLQTLQSLYSRGYPVMLFPEGRRSWNGRTEPIHPGIGRLIKRMNAHVVYARVHTGYFLQPRWAKYPRWVPIEITYDGPHHYPADWTVEQINQDVQHRIHVEASLTPGSRTWGYRMAVGLPSYLWACPACFRLEALSVDPADQNSVICSACQSRWTIDVETRLRGTSETTVAAAFEAIAAHVGQPPVADRAAFEDDGVALRESGATLTRVGGDQPGPIGTGELRLSADGLALWCDDAEVFSLPLQKMRAISVEVGNQLHFRVRGQLHDLKLAQGSRLKWGYFMRKWRLHVVGREY